MSERRECGFSASIIHHSSFIIFLLICRLATADPVSGELFDLSQPDGSLVAARIWGDEFHQIVESLDGYTLVRDANDGVICYATISGGGELISTGVRVREAAPPDLAQQKHLRPNAQLAQGIAAGSAGNAIVTGRTASAGFPASGGSPRGAGSDAFVARIGTNGSLAWSAFLAGSRDEFGWGIAASRSDDAVILTGWTNSADFPAQAAFDSDHNGDFDAYAARVDSPSGRLVWAAYLGGSDVDSASTLTISFSDLDPSAEPFVEEGGTLTLASGNIELDPRFAAPGRWDAGIEDPAIRSWVPGTDFHLKSASGRWDAASNDAAGGWVADAVSSPCIDAGDPTSDCSNEPQPNGGRINMGAYGNTSEASKTALRVAVRSTPVTGVAITGTKPGTTDYVAFCTPGAAVTFTAPASVAAGSVSLGFVRWVVDGVSQPAGQLALQLTVNADRDLEAVFEVPVPPPVTDLAAAAGEIRDPLPAASASASSVLYNNYPASYAIDGNAASFWSSAGTAAPRAEWITLDLGSIGAVGMVSMLPRLGWAHLFPATFTIEVSTDAAAWLTVASQTGYAAADRTWCDTSFPGYTARYVRVAIPAAMLNPYNGLHYVQIAEIQVRSQAVQSISLQWTAPDVGAGITADSYTMRWSTQEITSSAAWDAAADADGEPAPLPAGAPQSMDVRQNVLPRDTRAHFAIRSHAGGTRSEPSNSPSLVVPADATPPSGVTDLSASVVFASAPRLSPSAASCSSSLYRKYGGEYAIDADHATFWSSESSAAPRSEYLEVDLGAGVDVGLVRLLPRTGYLELFPAAFTIQASTDGANWKQAAQEAGYTAAQGTWWEHSITAVTARFIRIHVPQSMRLARNGLHYVQIAELELYGPGVPTAHLAWTAPGGDGFSGTASQYDVRFSLQPIADAAAWAAATPVSGEPPPMPAGTRQWMDLPLDFTLPTTVHFAIKARDAAGNESALSNSPAADMPGDVTAPCAVAGLAAVRLHDPSDGIIPAGAASSTALYGRFTAGYAIDGDPATLWSSESSAAPRAEQLTLDLGAILVIGEIRLLPRPGYPMLFPTSFAVRTSIDGSTWTTAFDEPEYAAADGVWYERNLAGLAARFIRLDAPQSMRFALNGRYYVQLAEFQVYAPAPVRLRLSWTAPGDDGTAGTAATYDIRYALAPITAGPAWAAANPIPDPPAPQPAGSPQSMEASLDLSPGAIIFFAITSTDEAGNTSALSNSPSIELPAAIPP